MFERARGSVVKSVMSHDDYKSAMEEMRYHGASVVDIHNLNANMYGVLPCPRCGSVMRRPVQNKVIHCEGCGFEQKVSEG